MLRIGIVGVGGIARNVHIRELQKIGDVKITAICDIREDRLKAVGDMLDIPESCRFTDYRDLAACPEVDAVEICTPNNIHIDAAMAAAKAGKAVEIEKPLDANAAKAPALEALVRSQNLPTMMSFSYRFRPAVRFAKELLEKGLLGDIINVNIEYLQSGSFIPGRRMEWRHQKEASGSGALGDLGAHLIDMTRFLFGEFKSVCAMMKTVVKERQLPDSDKIAPVETDDITSFIAELETGTITNFLATRVAHGHSNTIKYDVYGTKGVLSFNLNSPNELVVCIGDVDIATKSLHTVRVPDSYAVGQEASFIDLLRGNTPKYLPTLADGIACQKVLDALVLSAEESRRIDL